MLIAEKNHLRYKIQKRVALSCSAAILILVMVNVLTAVVARDYTFTETIVEPAVYVLLALGIVSWLTSVKDCLAFRLIHVAVFLLYPIFHTFLATVSPYNTSALPWSIYGIILAVQYGLMKGRFWKITAAYLFVYLTAKLVSASTYPEFAFHAAPGVVIIVVLFTYLFWIVFAEEIKHYSAMNNQLSLERDKNKIFVEFGRAIAGVIHNLKSVMMSIEGYGDLLRVTDKNEWDSIVALQKKSSRRMLEMINNFMTAVRSYQRAEKQVVALNSLVLSAAEVLRGNDVLKHKIRMSIDLGDFDTVEAVPMEIMQVIDNLVSNAAEAMIGTGRFDLKIRTGVQDDYVFLEVEDEGVGIPGCVTCKTSNCGSCSEFEIGKSSKEKGTGIGVVYIRQIVAEHGGKLVYRSVPGKGTIATVMLPAARTKTV